MSAGSMSSGASSIGLTRRPDSVWMNGPGSCTPSDGRALARRPWSVEDRAVTPARVRLIVLAAFAGGVGAAAILVSSHHQEAKVVWAIFGPLVAWLFVGTGIYATRRRPDSRTGELMVLQGFAWLLSALGTSNAPLPYTLGLLVGGLWGGVFLQLVLSFPSGRLRPGIDRALVIAGYVVFTVGSLPAMLVSGPHELGCDTCPTNLLLIERNAGLATAALALQALLYLALLLLVVARLVVRWRRT